MARPRRRLFVRVGRTEMRFGRRDRRVRCLVVEHAHRARFGVAFDAVDLAAHGQSTDLDGEFFLHLLDHPTGCALSRLHDGGLAQTLPRRFQLDNERQRKILSVLRARAAVECAEQEITKQSRIRAIAQRRLFAQRLECAVTKRAEIERVEFVLRRIHRAHAEHPAQIKTERALQPAAERRDRHARRCRAARRREHPRARPRRIRRRRSGGAEEQGHARRQPSIGAAEEQA